MEDAVLLEWTCPPDAAAALCASLREARASGVLALECAAAAGAAPARLVQARAPAARARALVDAAARSAGGGSGRVAFLGATEVSRLVALPAAAEEEEEVAGDAAAPPSSPRRFAPPSASAPAAAAAAPLPNPLEPPLRALVNAHFGVTVRSECVCRHCGNVSTRDEKLFELSLALAEEPSPNTAAAAAAAAKPAAPKSPKAPKALPGSGGAKPAAAKKSPIEKAAASAAKPKKSPGSARKKTPAGEHPTPPLNVPRFCKWVNEELLKDILSEPGTRRKPIDETTAFRWLHALGFKYENHKKNIYFDGHEREEHVAPALPQREVGRVHHPGDDEARVAQRGGPAGARQAGARPAGGARRRPRSRGLRRLAP